MLMLFIGGSMDGQKCLVPTPLPPIYTIINPLDHKYEAYLLRLDEQGRRIYLYIYSTDD